MLRQLAIIIGYLVAACFVVGVTFGLVAYGQGYSYSFSQHRVVRTGIVIIQSVPGGVPVGIDSRKAKKKTTYRQSFEAGEYTFNLARVDFHSWSKRLKVVAGEVTIAQYATLVPNDLREKTQFSSAPIVAQAISRDHRHLAYITSGSSAGVYRFDIGSEKPVRIYTPAIATPTAAAEELKNLSWSDDAAHLLVTSNIGDAPTVREMVADGTGAINLTDQYRFDFTGLKFSGNDWRQLYWISPDGLRRLDLGAQTVSGVLADQVQQVEVEPDRLLYVQTTSLGQSLWSLDYRSRKQQLISVLVPSDHYGLAYTTYRGTSALAVVPSQTQIGTLYTDILTENPVAQTIAHGVTDVSFSPDGHLVTFSGAASATTYDLDQSSVFGSPVSYNFALSGLASAPVWFDNFHLLLIENGRLVWSEFDGQNVVDLGAEQANLAAFASADLKTIYAYRPATPTAQSLVNLTIKR